MESIRTRAMTLRSARVPVAATRLRVAASLSDFGLVKPPWWSWLATGPPSAPARAVKATAILTTTQARLLARRAIQSSIRVSVLLSARPRCGRRGERHLRQGVEGGVAVELGVDEPLKCDAQEGSPDGRPERGRSRLRRVGRVGDHRTRDARHEGPAGAQEKADPPGGPRVVHAGAHHVE